MNTPNVVAISDEAIERSLNQQKKENILTGLYRGSVGFLIAPPDSGKSYLCLSIAYELALQESGLVGISCSDHPLKTLIWPIEDSLNGILPRVQDHLSGFSEGVKEALGAHIGVFDGVDPICCSRGRQNHEERDLAEKSLNELVNAAKNYDLVIIDTLREAVGSADEVDDDYHIRVVLDQLAKEADVAVLVVHHPTKEISRGKEIVNSVAGSGLSSTLSKSKLHLYLDPAKSARSGNKEAATRLRHIKANNVPYKERLSQPVTMSWSETSLLHVDPDVLERLSKEAVNNVRGRTKSESKARRGRINKLPDSPQIIQRDESLLSNKSKELAGKGSSPFGSGMAGELQLFDGPDDR